jgi:hypothetical protein
MTSFYWLIINFKCWISDINLFSWNGFFVPGEFIRWGSLSFTFLFFQQIFKLWSSILFPSYSFGPYLFRSVIND